MILLDTNIFIYLANGTLKPKLIKNINIAHSAITKIEALGYSDIVVNELLLLEELFNESYNLPLTDNIVNRAVKIRQQRRTSLSDAIIAATAIENDLVLWTANTDDFSHINGLKLHNPLVK